MIILLIAGIGAIAAGVLAIWFGIPVKEFSFGNTLILAGVIGICAGVVLIGLAFVVRELKVIARRLRSVDSLARQDAFGDAPLPAGSIADVHAAPAERSAHRRGRFSEDVSSAETVAPPLHASTAARGAASQTVMPPEPLSQEAAERPRRNLLFQSSRRARPQGAPSLDRTIEPDKNTDRTAASGAEAPPRPGPHPSFDDAWPRRENASRGSSAPVADSPAPQSSTDISVVKSGVVDGMAYSLYSDGSIEAQMPEGMMRFASIEDLRQHLDRRS